MAILVYGVTAAKLRAHHFPQQAGEFSTTTKPTAITVGETIDDAGADLAGKLRAKGIDPAAIVSASTPEAYAWCARTVRLAAAIETLGAMTGQDPAVGKKWATELRARLDDLDARGYLALGDAAAPAQQANGPRWHGATYELSTGDVADVSTLVPRFRRDDQL